MRLISSLSYSVGRYLSRRLGRDREAIFEYKGDSYVKVCFCIRCARMRACCADGHVRRDDRALSPSPSDVSAQSAYVAQGAYENRRPGHESSRLREIWLRRQQLGRERV